jgi:hypothetical protein
MKNAIDDADYIVNSRYYIFIYQYVMNSSYSHSIVNKPFLSLIFNDLFSPLNGNTKKNTMLRKWGSLNSTDSSDCYSQRLGAGHEHETELFIGVPRRGGEIGPRARAESGGGGQQGGHSQGHPR